MKLTWIGNSFAMMNMKNNINLARAAVIVTKAGAALALAAAALLIQRKATP
jgi:hypothetical protein